MGFSTGRPFGALSDEPEIVRDLAFGSDDRLAAVTPDGGFLLWDLGDLASGPRRLRVHGTGQVVSVAFSSVDDSIVTGAASGELRRVVPSAEPPIGPPLLALPALDYDGRSVEPLDIAVEGSRAVSVDPSGRVVVWDLEGRPPLGPELAPGRLYDRLETMPDPSVLTADREGVYVVDARDGHIVSQAAVDGVTALGSGPSGWAVGTGAGEVLVPSGTDGALRPIAGIPEQPVVGLAALPDGGWAAVGKGGTVAVLRGTGERRDVDLAATPTAIVGDGEWLFVGDMDGAIHVLSAADPGRPERLVQAHPYDIGSMALSPDGSTLATGSDDRTIALWDVSADGGLTERTRLRGQGAGPFAHLSPDGAWLASGGEEHAVRLWNLAAGAPVATRCRTDGPGRGVPADRDLPPRARGSRRPCPRRTATRRRRRWPWGSRPGRRPVALPSRAGRRPCRPSPPRPTPPSGSAARPTTGCSGMPAIGRSRPSGPTGQAPHPRPCPPPSPRDRSQRRDAVHRRLRDDVPVPCVDHVDPLAIRGEDRGVRHRLQPVVEASGSELRPRPAPLEVPSTHDAATGVDRHSPRALDRDVERLDRSTVVVERRQREERWSDRRFR